MLVQLHTSLFKSVLWYYGVRLSFKNLSADILFKQILQISE